MESKGSAIWTGTLKDGVGAISTQSKVLNKATYSFKSRFEGSAETNPEELVAAAHSACFSMALAVELEKDKIVPTNIETSATVVLQKKDDGFAVTDSKLICTVSAAGSDKAVIEKAAARTKENCPISKLLNANISLELNIN